MGHIDALAALADTHREYYVVVLCDDGEEYGLYSYGRDKRSAGAAAIQQAVEDGYRGFAVQSIEEETA